MKYTLSTSKYKWDESCDDWEEKHEMESEEAMDKAHEVVTLAGYIQIPSMSERTQVSHEIQHADKIRAHIRFHNDVWVGEWDRIDVCVHIEATWLTEPSLKRLERALNSRI